jgi:hypothetical protein
MKSSDYLPQPYADLREWMDNFVAYLKTTAVMARLKLEPKEVEDLEAEAKAYDDACAVADGANAGSVDKNHRKLQAKSVKKTVREFVNGRLRYNKLVTDDDRKAMGLTIPDTTPTPETPPKERPLLEPDTSKIRTVTIKIVNEEGDAAKPEHVHGTELVWGFIPEGEKPSFIHLKETLFTTTSHASIDVDEEDRGKRIGVSGRYENHRGGKGKFGEIIVVYIP